MFCELSEYDEHSIISDERTGDFLCKNCGLVLGTVYMHTTPAVEMYPLEEMKPTLAKKSKKNKNKLCENEIVSLIEEICSKLHIVGSNLIAEIVNDCVSFHREWHNFHTFKSIDIISFMIYNSIRKHLILPRSIKDICSITKANMKNVWKLQKKVEMNDFHKVDSDYKLTVDDEPISPKHLIMSKLGYINLKYDDFIRMEKVLNNTNKYHRDFAMATIAATIVFQYLKYYKKEHVTMKMVAQLFLTSAMSVYRLQKYLKQEGISFFEAV